MFVPSLSWQNYRFSTMYGKPCPKRRPFAAPAVVPARRLASGAVAVLRTDLATTRVVMPDIHRQRKRLPPATATVFGRPLCINGAVSECFPYVRPEPVLVK